MSYYRDLLNYRPVGPISDYSHDGGFISLPGIIKKGVNAVKEGYNRVKQAIAGPREDYPPAVRDLIKQYGDWHIYNIVCCRKPIMKIFDKALDLISLGRWSANKSKFKYDDMFHLYLMVSFGKGTTTHTYRFEKNHVIEIYQSTDYGSESKTVPLYREQIYLGNFMANGRAFQGPSFFHYDGRNNNCQVFVWSLLKGNKIASPELESFIKQNAEEVLTGDVGRFARAVTDVASRADILINGKALRKQKRDAKRKIKKEAKKRKRIKM